MTYALVNTQNEIVRELWFAEGETPPILAPEKGVTWLQLVENYPVCDDTQMAGPAVITVDREAGTVTKDYPAIAKPPMPEELRIAALWQAAHDYEYAQVSGSAIGLLAMGVMQGLPKCVAVQNWIKGIWELYYTRKAGTSTDCDYSGCGVCPYSVPELMTELGL